MFTILNKKELIVTYDINVQSKVRDILQSKGIDYRIKVIDRNSASPFSAGNRGRFSTFGERVHLEKEYIIFVKKEDFEIAKQLIARI